jgi:hypothetical protein
MPRAVVAVLTAAVIFIAFSAVGGVSFAKRSATANAYQYQYDRGKVTICHHKPNGQRVTMKVRPEQLSFHMSHGDTFGPCP